MRVGLLWVPGFSTDPQRFLSDGVNLLQGKNPYTAPPALPIAYGHLRSFYPPLLEGFFAFAVWLWPDGRIFRILGGLLEIFFLAWFFHRKRQRPLPKSLVLFLLFNPLSVHEIWREGHLDHVAAFALFLAIANLRASGHRNHKLHAAFFMLFSIGWKLIGVFAAPFYLPRQRSSRLLQQVQNPYLWLALGFLALQLLPVWLFTEHSARGLTVYTLYWHHGNGIIHFLSSLGFADAHGVWLVKRGIFVLCLAISLFYFLRWLNLIHSLVLAVGSLLVFFPVQHPWYYFLLFPFILLLKRWRNVLMLLCLLSPLSYLDYIPASFPWGFWLKAVLWLACVFHFIRKQTWKLFSR
ncbi:MAG: hypothetical protein N2Z22_04125 [Turneriella sp.]|nr:hypothetical protein [Turneriella sp.]